VSPRFDVGSEIKADEGWESLAIDTLFETQLRATHRPVVPANGTRRRGGRCMAAAAV